MRGIRLLVLGVIWLGSFFLAFDRVNISLAAPRIMEELAFDGVRMGLVLSAYYWGYMLGNFFGGLHGGQERLRGITTLLILVWSALTALSGSCHTLWQFGAVRVAFGLAEGATANLMHRLQNNWLLPAERGRGYGIFIGFVYLGIALGMPLVGWLIKTWDWRMMFYLSGLMTLTLVVLFWGVVRDHPAVHPWLPAAEGRALYAAIAGDRERLEPAGHAPPTLGMRERLRRLFAIPHFWRLCVAAFFCIGVYFTNMSWLPGYLVRERGYSILASGIYLTIPYLAAFAGMWAAGALGDKLGNRSAVALVMGLLSCPAIIALAYSTEVNATIALMSLMLFLNSAALNGIMVLLFDIVPAEIFGAGVGLVGGLSGGLAGIVGPLLVGWLYDLTGSFVAGFYALAAGVVIGAVFLWPMIAHERQVKQAKRARQL